MKLVCAGLGEDFDAAVAELVVLGRKRILVDADLADRFLRGELASAESIDEDCATAGSGRRAGERQQVRLEILGIVGQRLQIGAAQHQRARVVRGVGGDGRPGIIPHDYLLRRRDNF